MQLQDEATLQTFKQLEQLEFGPCSFINFGLGSFDEHKAAIYVRAVTFLTILGIFRSLMCHPSTIMCGFLASGVLFGCNHFLVMELKERVRATLRRGHTTIDRVRLHSQDHVYSGNPKRSKLQNLLHNKVLIYYRGQPLVVVSPARVIL